MVFTEIDVLTFFRSLCLEKQVFCIKGGDDSSFFITGFGAGGGGAVGASKSTELVDAAKAFRRDCTCFCRISECV